MIASSDWTTLVDFLTCPRTRASFGREKDTAVRNGIDRAWPDGYDEQWTPSSEGSPTADAPGRVGGVC